MYVYYIYIYIDRDIHNTCIYIYKLGLDHNEINITRCDSKGKK